MLAWNNASTEVFVAQAAWAEDTASAAASAAAPSPPMSLTNVTFMCLPLGLAGRRPTLIQSKAAGPHHGQQVSVLA